MLGTISFKKNKDTFFITSLSKAALSHKPATRRTSRDCYRAQGHDTERSTNYMTQIPSCEAIQVLI